MPERKSTRLNDYDYSTIGNYFVTICTLKRGEWLGKVEDGRMMANENGEIADACWKEIPYHNNEADIDEFSIMPNHVHGIILIERKTKVVGDAYMRPLPDRTKMSLSNIVQQYKSAVRRRINSSQSNFCFKWQRSYYDHVIRNESELNRIREYIRNNPLKWNSDRENLLSRNLNVPHDLYWKEIYDPVGQSMDCSRKPDGLRRYP